MSGYRYEVPATIMFTVYAESDEEAATKAKAIVDQFMDGVNIDDLDDAEGVRGYFVPDAVPDFIDYEDDDEDLDEEDEEDEEECEADSKAA